MSFEKAQFEMSAGISSQLPKSGVPEIVFSGRSNVGKSSLINKLLNRKSLARVSSTPGKTATINFYDLGFCRFVDLPGYGYAKVSFAEKKRWGGLVEGYFNSNRNIKAFIQLTDIRRMPTADDFQMINYISGKCIPCIIAATKADKLNTTQRIKQIGLYYDKFRSTENTEFIAVSSATGEGVEQIRHMITALC